MILRDLVRIRLHFFFAFYLLRTKRYCDIQKEHIFFKTFIWPPKKSNINFSFILIGQQVDFVSQKPTKFIDFVIMAIANVTNFCLTMEIPKISKLYSVWSLEIRIHGFPWKVKVCKKGKDAEQSIAVHLYCDNKEN